MLKEDKIPHVDGCLVNENEINKLKKLVDIDKPTGLIDTHLVGKVIKNKSDIETLKESFNELRNYVKERTEYSNQ